MCNVIPTLFLLKKNNLTPSYSNIPALGLVAEGLKRISNSEGTRACCGKHSELFCSDCVNAQHMALPDIGAFLVNTVHCRRTARILQHECTDVVKWKCFLANVCLCSYLRSKPVRHQCVLTGPRANVSLKKVLPALSCLLIRQLTVESRLSVPPSVSAVSNLCFSLS